MNRLKSCAGLHRITPLQSKLYSQKRDNQSTKKWFFVTKSGRSNKLGLQKVT
jgi:hypothetical protein